MIQSRRMMKLLAVPALMLAGAALAGCSTGQTSYLQPTDPGVSPYAVASADEGAFVAEPFGLVAADSIGLATFGTEIAQADRRYEREASAEAR